MTLALTPRVGLRASTSRIYPGRNFTGLLQSAYASTVSPAPPPPEASSSSFSPRRRRRSDLPTSGVDLVAPPDPISNIRPVIYASTPIRRRSSNSPYSASEFPSYGSGGKLGEMELEWRLARERVDLMNHRFWAGMNTDFNAQLAHRLSLLPLPSDPPTTADEKRREDCLAQFYADWQIANRAAQGKWVREWWRELWNGLRMQGRIYLARALRRG